jgi:hypothetical protein
MTMPDSKPATTASGLLSSVQSGANGVGVGVPGMSSFEAGGWAGVGANTLPMPGYASGPGFMGMPGMTGSMGMGMMPPFAPGFDGTADRVPPTLAYMPDFPSSSYGQGRDSHSQQRGESGQSTSQGPGAYNTQNQRHDTKFNGRSAPQQRAGSTGQAELAGSTQNTSGSDAASTQSPHMQPPTGYAMHAMPYSGPVPGPGMHFPMAPTAGYYGTGPGYMPGTFPVPGMPGQAYPQAGAPFGSKPPYSNLGMNAFPNQGGYLSPAVSAATSQAQGSLEDNRGVDSIGGAGGYGSKPQMNAYDPSQQQMSYQIGLTGAKTASQPKTSTAGTPSATPGYGTSKASDGGSHIQRGAGAFLGSGYSGAGQPHMPPFQAPMMPPQAGVAGFGQARQPQQYPGSMGGGQQQYG